MKTASLTRHSGQCNGSGAPTKLTSDLPGVTSQPKRCSLVRLLKPMEKLHVVHRSSIGIVKAREPGTRLLNILRPLLVGTRG